MSEIEYIDGILKRFWVEELPKQYKDNHLLKEDSLKCEIYHYLRCKLENGWLIRHRIRIYPEYLFENGKKADIAIVRLCPKYETNDKYLGDCIEEVIAIIELKYKSGNINKDFYSDVSKLKEYASSFANCQLYAGFIQEYYHACVVIKAPEHTQVNGHIFCISVIIQNIKDFANILKCRFGPLIRHALRKRIERVICSEKCRDQHKRLFGGCGKSIAVSRLFESDRIFLVNMP